jgi:hypothetical protein
MMESGMRTEPAMMAHDRGLALARRQTDSRSALFDLAGFVFGLLFFAFLLTGLSIATRAATPDGHELSAFEFPEVE